MKKITILIVLAFIVIIAACGKMGELERIKSSLGVSSIIQMV
ncbi:hypothetical protein [Candidatus Vesicomyidisocius sp. SY067_SCS001]|nr:hypothetical protein [Candidatus Vesicomyosocius sp. SY067_SCS001]